MNKQIIGTAFFTGKINGVINFYQNKKDVTIELDINGLKKNSVHGFHIHEAGDLSDNCMGY